MELLQNKFSNSTTLILIACVIAMLTATLCTNCAYAEALNPSNLVADDTENATTQIEGTDSETQPGVRIEHGYTEDGTSPALIAVPDGGFYNARFEYRWEVSKDSGRTWESIDSVDGQPLMIALPNDSFEQGYQYRVVMTAAEGGDDDYESLTISTNPIVVGNGNNFAIVLEYDPPLAGQTAYFQTTLYGAKSGVDIKYTWQQSQDGGVTWTDIVGCTGSSLAIPTNSIDPNADVSNAPTSITYIRAIAEETSGDKRVAVSEAVPLTVHVDEKSSAISSDDRSNLSSREQDENSTNQAIETAPIADIRTNTSFSYINKSKVTASDLRAAALSGATVITLGPKTKAIAKRAFTGTDVRTIVLASKKLAKKRMKGALEGSSVKTVKVQVKKQRSTRGLKGKALKAAKKHNKKAKAINDKYVEKYKEFFTKENSGKKVNVK